MERIRGQAAVTDALYFLIIVTGITIFLFGFANTFGASVDAEIVKNYNVDFSTDALKTILYSSVPRDPDGSLYFVPPEEPEIDHLLAYVKEDYADNKELERTTQVVLADNIKGILNPIADNFDYLFTISVPEGAEKGYVFVFFHKTNLEVSAAGVTAIGVRKSDVTVSVPAFTEFFCATQPVDYDALKTSIQKLLANVGETSSSSSKIKLVKIGPAGGLTDVPAQADLVIWNPTVLYGAVSGAAPDFGVPPWYCLDRENFEASINSP